MAATSSWAAPVKGCEQTVMTAMEKKAQARVAYDVASTEQILTKPDSTLFMTCFNNSAGNSAAQLGTIFSGDYTAGLNRIVPDALTAFDNDFEESMGTISGTVDYTQTALGTNITACDQIQPLWQAVSDEGIKKHIPYVLYGDLKVDALPGTLTANAVDDPDPTENFGEDWTHSANDGVFSDLANATAAGTLPQAPVPDYTPTTTACSVLQTATVPISIPVICP